MTQPALSMQVRELEREIGAELVERRPGEIALTDTGLEVAQRAEHILAATRDLVDFARHRDVLSGRLRSASSRRWRLTFCRACCRGCRRTIRICGWNCARRRPSCCSTNLRAASSTP